LKKTAAPKDQHIRLQNSHQTEAKRTTIHDAGVWCHSLHLRLIMGRNDQWA
jgi:hypothetical protein